MTQKELQQELLRHRSRPHASLYIHSYPTAIPSPRARVHMGMSNSAFSHVHWMASSPGFLMMFAPQELSPNSDLQQLQFYRGLASIGNQLTE